jgi:3-oxoacyl-[acyl-carrier protein] reductase
MRTISSYKDLSGRVAVVTGASSPIGVGILRALVENGVAVAVSGRNKSVVEELAEAIRSEGGQAMGVVADVTQYADLNALREKTESELGPVDIVVAFAGGQGMPVSVTELSLETWNQSLAINLTGAFLTLKAFLPGMIHRRRGSIITLASTAGRATSPASPAYGAAKAGLLMLTRQAALQVAEYGVRVNALAPGAVLEGKAMSQEVCDQIARSHPLKRTGTPQDIAEATLFLASDASSWITGSTIDVNGGRIMV